MSSVIVIEERLRTRALSIAVAAVALLVAAVEALVLSSSSSSTSWIAVVVVAAAFVSLSLVFVGSLKVIVRVLDERGGRTLEILYGPGPLIRQRFGADEIVEASAQQFSFTTIGGWGYRGSLRFFRYAALATRSGEALMVNLSRGRRFVVTVDEPESFAVALKTK